MTEASMASIAHCPEEYHPTDFAPIAARILALLWLRERAIAEAADFVARAEQAEREAVTLVGPRR
jgi:hypothetical protein